MALTKIVRNNYRFALELLQILKNYFLKIGVAVGRRESRLMARGQLPALQYTCAVASYLRIRSREATRFWYPSLYPLFQLNGGIFAVVGRWKIELKKNRTSDA